MTIVLGKRKSMEEYGRIEKKRKIWEEYERFGKNEND